MGNAYAHRRRLAPALILLAVLTFVVVAFAGISAQNARAIGAYAHGGASCSSCHTSSPQSAANASSAKCITCHAGYALPKATLTCWNCHNPGQSMAAVKAGAPATCTQTCHLADNPSGTVAGSGHNPHPSRGTCTTCHNVTTGIAAPNGSPHHTVAQTPPPVVVTTTMTAKLAPTTVRLGKKVKVTGTAGPATSLAGAKVAFKVERKVGTKWVKMKATATATVGTTGAFTWSYKAVKKGAHRVTLTIAATSTHTKKTIANKKFTVK
jgi:predicted secreted protein